MLSYSFTFSSNLLNTYLGKIQWKYLISFNTGAIQPVRWGGGGEISLIFGSQVSLRVHCCKRDEAYFTTLLWQDGRRQNGLKSRSLFPELYKIMVNKVTFIGFRGGGDRPNLPLDSPLLIMSLPNKSVRTLNYNKTKLGILYFMCRIKKIRNLFYQ